jgi:hypothetical protein
MATFFAPTPTYKAPTFQELAAPLEIYRQAYSQLEEKYDAEKDKAAMLQAMLGTDPDNEINNYMADYNALMDQTARAYSNGTLPYSQLVQNYKQLRNIWQDKGVKMTAAIDAFTKYKDAKSKMPGAIGPEYSLSDFLKQPTRQYSFINTADVEKQSANLFKSISASMPPQVRGSFMNDAMIMMSQGMSANDILGLMQQDSPYSPFVQNIQGMYGDEYVNLDDNSKRKYDMAIQRGAIAGLEQMKAMENPKLDQQLKQMRLATSNLAYQDALIDHNIKVTLNNTWAQLPDGTYVNGLGVPSSTVPKGANIVDYTTLEQVANSGKSKKSKNIDPSVYSFENVYGYPDINEHPTMKGFANVVNSDPMKINPNKKLDNLPASGFSFYDGNETKITLKPVAAFNAKGEVVMGVNEKGKKVNNIGDAETGTIVGYGFYKGNPIRNNINANIKTGFSTAIPMKVQEAIKADPNLDNPDYVIMKTKSDNYVVMTAK